MTPGEGLQYVVTVRNEGTQTLANVRVNQNFNSLVVYQNGSTTAEKDGKTITVDDGWTGAGGFNFGSLTSGQTGYLKFTGTISPSAVVGSTIQNAVAVRSDQTDWVGQGHTVTVVSPDTSTTLRSGDFLKVTNNTLQNGWQDSVSVGPSDVVEFLVKISNDGNFDARGVRLKADLPANPANPQHPSVTVSSDNAQSVSDNVTVTGQRPFWFVYKVGHATLFGSTDLYNCPTGCSIPESFYLSPLMLGTVKKGESASIQVTYKADIFTPASPTPTPTKTPTPTPTKTPTPTPTKTPTPTPTKTPCHQNCTPTPTPTRTPTHTPTPTPTVTPTVTPTPTPVMSKLKICKFNDVNGDGQINNGESTMGWNFTYSYQGQEFNVGSRWWDILNRGCRTVDVPVSQWITVSEESRDGWNLTNILSDGNAVGGSSFSFVAYANTQKDVTFLNHNVVNTTPTPTPTVTATPTGAPNSCGGTCGDNGNCASGLFCYQGFCRNPSCQTESSCNCPGATATPTAPPVLGATAPPVLPKTGANDVGVVAGLLGTMSGGFFLFRKFRLI